MELDETWSVFASFSADPRDFVKEFLPEIYLKPKVAKAVKENFEVIEKLLLYSYSVYKFYNVATLKSLLTLEMSLKIRYREVTGVEWGHKPLKLLIDWFQKRNYFEVYNNDFLIHIREIRNMLAHPNDHTFSGPHSRPVIENVLDLINGLYEEPGLRV